MSDLQKVTNTLDLMVIGEVVDNNLLKERNWESIIRLHNSKSNKPFLIEPIVCSKIIQDIKEGYKIDWVFRSYNLNYKTFKERYNKIKTFLEEVSELPEVTNDQFALIENLLSDPTFLLGQDIDKAAVYWLKLKTKEKEELSTKPDEIEKHMKLIHPDEFKDDSGSIGFEISFKIAPGLLDEL